MICYLVRFARRTPIGGPGFPAADPGTGRFTHGGCHAQLVRSDRAWSTVSMPRVA